MVIVELKSVEQMAPVHKKQLLTYLRLADKHLGLLINFGESLIKHGITRVVNHLKELDSWRALRLSEKIRLTTVAYFISPHGLGHAARASAVINAIHRQQPKLRFEIFTNVPRWFFLDSLAARFTYHKCLTDIGLAQETPLKENVPQTLKRLRDFLPFDPAFVSPLARQIRHCDLVVCDIAPLGIAVARQAGVPSALIENFTWDWIYKGYANAHFEKHIAYLHSVFHAADHHIQTEPVCDYWQANIVTPPVSRAPRTSKTEIRKQLAIPPRAKTVLITMGGIPEQHAFIARLQEMRGVHFVIPGAKFARRHANLILLPHRSEFYHPDLMNAADVVIGKAGYSTVAEAYHAGIPFGFVTRAKFREAEAMARFIKQKMRGIEIPASKFLTGEWMPVLDKLLALPRIKQPAANGAEPIAKYILKIVE